MLGDKAWLTVPIYPNVLVGLVEVRALGRPVQFFNTKMVKIFLYGPFFCAREHSSLKKRSAFLKLLPHSW